VDASVSVRSKFPFPYFVANYPVFFVARWWLPGEFLVDFGGGVIIRINPTESYLDFAGTYNVQLSAYYPGLGQSLTVTTQVQVGEPMVYYVDAHSPTPVAPYTNWSTAATASASGCAGTCHAAVFGNNGLLRDMGSSCMVDA